MTEPALLPDHVYRAMLYIERLTIVGARPTRGQVESYAVTVAPRGPVESSLAARFAAIASQITSTVLAPEPVVAYLIGVGWVAVSGSQDDSIVELTSLGSAVLVGLRESSPAEIDLAEGVGVVVLDPAEPFVYLTVTRAAADAGRGMIVDPFFKPDMLRWLVDTTTIARLLIKPSDRERQSVLARFGVALAGLDFLLSGNRVDIRASSDDAMHDRCMVYENGEIRLLGTSLSGVGKHLSTLTPLPPAAVAGYAAHLEALWSAAEPIEARGLRNPEA